MILMGAVADDEDAFLPLLVQALPGTASVCNKLSPYKDIGDRGDGI